MRRTILMTLTAAVLAALAVSAVSLATGDDEAASDRPARASAAGLLAAAGGTGATGMPDLAAISRSIAERLDVTEAELRAAVHAAGPAQARDALDRAVEDGTITARERALVERCAEDRASCDREGARELADRLKTRVERDGLEGLGVTALRDGLAADVGARLKRTPEQVVAAVGAEVDATLTGLREAGILTERAQELAQACFADPDACDLDALREEVPFLQGMGGGLGRRD
jgi:hypothetical protein